MIVETVVRFKRRRDPYPYDMSDKGGPAGVSYSFEALDQDDEKVRIKCPETVWTLLAKVEPMTPLYLRLEVRDAKVDGPDGLGLDDTVFEAA